MLDIGTQGHTDMFDIGTRCAQEDLISVSPGHQYQNRCSWKKNLVKRRGAWTPDLISASPGHQYQTGVYRKNDIGWSTKSILRWGRILHLISASPGHQYQNGSGWPPQFDIGNMKTREGSGGRVARMCLISERSVTPQDLISSGGWQKL